jgi:PAS domain S-box-containing protein
MRAKPTGRPVREVMLLAMSPHGGVSPREPEYALVRILAEAGTVQEASQRLLELIAGEFSWSYGALWMPDDGTELLRIVDDWSSDEAELHEFRRLNRRLTFGPGVGLPGSVWSTGEPTWIADVGDDANFPRVELAARAGLHAAVALPVIGPGGVLGVMEFLTGEVRPVEPEQVDLLRTLGRQVGQYVARVHAEDRLRATQEVSAGIVRAALDCVITMDHEGHIVDFNPAAEDTFGYRREEAIGRTVAELLIPPDLRAAHARALHRYVDTGEATILNRRLELVAMRADGTTLPVELTVARVGTGRPPLFAGFVRDISARLRTDAEVTALLEREHDARLRAEEAERSTRRVADVLQRSLLPPHLPAIPGVELGAAYRAGSEASVVGGDFYDVFALGPGRWGIAIGDVRGKGPDAASLTALVRYAIRTAAVRETSPRDVLAWVNEALLRDTPEDDFCTAIYASLAVDGASPVLRLAVGGHPLPLLATGEGDDHRVTTAGRAGTVLGAIADPMLHDHEIRLGHDDVLLLYTDGVIDSPTPDGRLGEAGLGALLTRCVGLEARAVARLIEAAIVGADDHDGGSPQRDDVALLALRAHPAIPPAR